MTIIGSERGGRIMTDMQKPKFVDTEWFVGTPGQWHLKPGAPAEVKREFNRWMKAFESASKPPQNPPVIDVDPEDLRK